MENAAGNLVHFSCTGRHIALSFLKTFSDIFVSLPYPHQLEMEHASIYSFLCELKCDAERSPPVVNLDPQNPFNIKLQELYRLVARFGQNATLLCDVHIATLARMLDTETLNSFVAYMPPTVSIVTLLGDIANFRLISR